MKKIRKLLNTDWMMYVIIGILSAAIFCLIYGVKILNPTYTDWLLSGGDLSQHYLGWRGYRASAWHFPIGMVDTLAYPYLTSIIFTDSIPVFAVIFKVLSPLLPANFQYFGFWGIMCFVLQGIFAARIIHHYSPSRILTVIASLIFPLTPVLIWRMYSHTSLAGQWIILFGLDLIFNREKYKNKKKLYWTVGIMGGLAASIHMYFALICGIIIVGFIIKELLEKESFIRSIVVLAEYLCMVAAVTFLLGGFNSGMAAQSDSLGRYSFNLNSFINPKGWSYIFKDMPWYDDYQYEGFSYLGAGCILAAVLSVIAFVSSKEPVKRLSRNWKTLVSLLVIAVIAAFVALSPIVTINDHLIVEWKLPQFVINIWSIFRATGRIIWIDIYIIMLTSAIVVLKCFNKRTSYLVLISSLLLQPYDLQVVIKQRTETFNTTVQFDSILDTTDFWNKLAQNEKIKHIVYYYAYMDQNILFSVTDWALTNHKTVNDFYFARSLVDTVAVNREKVLSELPEDTIIIFPEKDKGDCVKYDLHYYEIDNMVVGCPEAVDGFTELTASELTNGQ